MESELDQKERREKELLAEATLALLIGGFRPLVIVESPYSGTEEEVRANVDYLRFCMKDSVRRKELPFASHAMYPSFLDDNSRIDRLLGIAGGYVVGGFASHSQSGVVIAFYCDRGISRGMEMAQVFWKRMQTEGCNVRIEERFLFAGEGKERTA